MKRCLRWLPVILLAAPSLAHAELPTRQEIDNMMDKLGGDNQFDSSKGIDWGVLPGPFFTPELGLGIGTAVVGMYRPDKNDTVSQNSTLTLSGFVSTTGAFGVGFNNYSFFDNDQWRFFATGSMNNMPTYYWGTGFQAGLNDSNKEKYTQQALKVAPVLLYRIANSTYAGIGWDFSSTHAKDPEGGDNSLLNSESAGPSSLSSGISGTLSYDSRDFVANASRGQYLSMTYTHFAPELGSDSRFDTLETVYDIYHSLSDKSVLALDFYNRLATGDVPWDRMSELGSDKRMRGYYEGRYRDRNVFSSQIEYRRKLDWRNGYVLWAGTGTMSHDVDDLGQGHWLPTVGVGYRFEFKPRMNVRLDLGFGRNSAGFYFQMGEAF